MKKNQNVNKNRTAFFLHLNITCYLWANDTFQNKIKIKKKKVIILTFNRVSVNVHLPVSLQS